MKLRDWAVLAAALAMAAIAWIAAAYHQGYAPALLIAALAFPSFSRHIAAILSGQALPRRQKTHKETE